MTCSCNFNIKNKTGRKKRGEAEWGIWVKIEILLSILPKNNRINFEGCLENILFLFKIYKKW